MTKVIKRILENNDIDEGATVENSYLYVHRFLVPCVVEVEEESISIDFDMNGLDQFTNLKNSSKHDKFRALANISDLNRFRAEYSFPLSPDNLTLDVNLCPKVLIRDNAQGNDNFVDEYKSLIGSILMPRYHFEDYYHGGKDLFKKDKFLKRISQADTPDTIREILLDAYYSELENIRKHKKMITKARSLATRIIIPVLITALATLSVKSYLLIYHELPYKNSALAAYGAYLAEDYISAQKAMESYATEMLPLECKYILARSYVITESLSSAQKENILSGISLKTDERVLIFWIETGRLNFESAIDYAKRLGDDELLLFALIKHNATIKNDSTISGEEKVTLAVEIESEINSIKEKRTSELSEISKDSLA